jgi:hypothetical protein
MLEMVDSTDACIVAFITGDGISAALDEPYRVLEVWRVSNLDAEPSTAIDVS